MSMPSWLSKIAGGPKPADKKSVAVDSEFSRAIRGLVAERRPRYFLETGTFLGMGTTQIIGQAILAAGLTDYDFISIEVNPKLYRQAVKNLEGCGFRIDPRLGLSLPQAMLPTDQALAGEIAEHRNDGVYIDYAEDKRVEKYQAEVDFRGQDDLMGKAIGAWQGRVDFALLDSAGHLGFREFKYFLTKLRTPCLLALDDTRHLKHCESLKAAKADSRFKLLVESDEKFGFAIMDVTPGT